MFVLSVVLFGVSSCTVLLSLGVVDLREKTVRKRSLMLNEAEVVIVFSSLLLCISE